MPAMTALPDNSDLRSHSANLHETAGRNHTLHLPPIDGVHVVTTLVKLSHASTRAEAYRVLHRHTTTSRLAHGTFRIDHASVFALRLEPARWSPLRGAPTDPLAVFLPTGSSVIVPLLQLLSPPNRYAAARSRELQSAACSAFDACPVVLSVPSADAQSNAARPPPNYNEVAGPGHENEDLPSYIESVSQALPSPPSSDRDSDATSIRTLDSSTTSLASTLSASSGRMGEEAMKHAFNTVGYMSVVTQHFRDPSICDHDVPLSYRHIVQMVITLADLPIEIFEAAVQSVARRLLDKYGVSAAREHQLVVQVSGDDLEHRLALKKLGFQRVEDGGKQEHMLDVALYAMRIGEVSVGKKLM